MRPGQAAPEFKSPRWLRSGLTSCFNEAGAGCPGIHGIPYLLIKPIRQASMRPGQAAPEFG